MRASFDAIVQTRMSCVLLGMTSCARVRVCMCVCVCVSVCVRARVRVSARTRVRTRTFACARVRLAALVRVCVLAFPSAKYFRVRAGSTCVCVCGTSVGVWNECGCTPHLCRRSCGTGVTCVIYRSARSSRAAARACLRVVPSAWVARRWHMETDRQRAVGCAISAHVRDRRRRRHLRHRRLQ